MQIKTYQHHYRAELKVSKRFIRMAIMAIIAAVVLVGAFFVWMSSESYVEPLGEVPADFEPLELAYNHGHYQTKDGEWVAKDGYNSPLDPRRKHLEGIASWYGTGEGECLGCNPNRTMANGQRLDDEAHTIACNDYPLGTRVLVQNVENGMYVEAEVTDTGGFTSPKYNRVADLTKATRDAINCGGLCEVRVFPLEI